MKAISIKNRRTAHMCSCAPRSVHALAVERRDKGTENDIVFLGHVSLFSLRRLPAPHLSHSGVTIGVLHVRLCTAHFFGVIQQSTIHGVKREALYHHHQSAHILTNVKSATGKLTINNTYPKWITYNRMEKTTNGNIFKFMKAKSSTFHKTHTKVHHA